jgi:hypothetical protein
VQRDQHGDAVLTVQLGQDVHHPPRCFWVQRCDRLVGDDHAGALHQGAGDGGALLLPARQPVGELVALVGQREPIQQVDGASLGLALRQTERLARRERHVAQHAHVREQVEGLEHDADPLPDPVDVDATRRDLLALDDDAAAVDGLEQVDAAKQRRLPRAARPDEANDLVLADLEIDPFQHLELAERLVEPLDHECVSVALRHRPPPVVAYGRAPRASRRTAPAGW